MAPGQRVEAGYTVISTVGPFRDWLFQPQDLEANTPVRMAITVTPFADPQCTQPIPDADRSNNVLDLWLMRVRG